MSTHPESLAGVAAVDCSGQTALVTGSTNGIGRAVALALGRLGADVFVHGRDRDAGAAVVDELTGMGVRATFQAADFTDPDAVHDLADAVHEWCDGLDLLLNNAGGLFQNTTLVGPGVEITFYVNHLATYLLTADLLDHLTETARIVTTASAAHRGATLTLDRVQGDNPLSGMNAYSHSKLANVLFASELARRLDARGQTITSNSVHPGFIPGSGFWRFMPGPLSFLFRALGMMPGTSTVDDGAAELLVPALAPETTDVSGRYFTGQEPVSPSDAARDRDAAARLWRESAEILGIEEPLADVRPSVS